MSNDTVPRLMLQKFYIRLKKTSELKKQLIKFTFIGGLAVLTDLLFYFIFLTILPEKSFNFVSNEALSKTLSFMCGTFVTYNLNKFWTWKEKKRSHIRYFKFLFLYSLSLVINVGLNSTFLYLFGLYEVDYKYFFAFIGASGFSAAFNFVGQKIWVFKKTTEHEKQEFTEKI